jgi:hypothetical protein
MEVEHIKAGKYTFTVKNDIMKYGDRIMSHIITIGGDYSKCGSVSYTYKDNTPISAKLPHLLYEPECSIGSDLDKSGGTVQMIKALINYAYKKVPEIHLFQFDDMSKIDCVEKDLSQSPPRSLKKPIDLNYFSIAYHNMTWYELNFNAKMEDKEAYKKYRNSLGFLTSKEEKDKLKALDFLQSIQCPVEHVEYLKEKYEKTETFRDFFKSIPRDDRCKYLQHWITSFMEKYLKKIFINEDWEIDVLDMESKRNTKVGGKYTRKRGKNNKLKYRVNNKGNFHSL